MLPSEWPCFTHEFTFQASDRLAVIRTDDVVATNLLGFEMMDLKSPDSPCRPGMFTCWSDEEPVRRERNAPKACFKSVAACNRKSGPKVPRSRAAY
jgi:hypothetical protein